MDKTILQQEYDKAIKRLVEQRKVLDDCQISAAQKDFPSLSATAKRRLPKLQQTHDETHKLVVELSKALGYDQVQLDIEEVIKQPDLTAVPPASKKR